MKDFPKRAMRRDRVVVGVMGVMGVVGVVGVEVEMEAKKKISLFGNTHWCRLPDKICL